MSQHLLVTKIRGAADVVAVNSAGLLVVVEDGQLAEVNGSGLFRTIPLPDGAVVDAVPFSGEIAWAATVAKKRRSEKSSPIVTDEDNPVEDSLFQSSAPISGANEASTTRSA